MAFTPKMQPVTESNDELRRILEDPAADLPPVLPALAYATGRLDLLVPELRLDPTKFLEEQGGWTAEQQEQCRRLAQEALAAIRDGELRTDHTPSETELLLVMEWLTGTELSGSYGAMLTEELAPDDTDPRAPTWQKSDVAPDRPFTVAIVGAGMSGILAAHRFKQAGVDVVILEKNSGIGGTWFENTYPGCRVDVSNHVYCYSFMQKHDWPQFHSSQNVLLQYFNDCADHFGVRDHIRFDTEVNSVVWDHDAKAWNLELTTPDGEATLQAHAVVSAVGQLNRPAYPDIAGRDTFGGPTFHSARWNHDLDLAGKRVAVIGTGCSAMQLIPRVAERAAELTIFQRTPNWLMPRPQYQQELPAELMWLFTHVPHFHNWFRLRLFWRSHEGLLPQLEVDPDWGPHDDASISAGNQELGAMLRGYLQLEFADRPDLLEQVTPRYAMGAKRFVIDDGLWARTLKSDHVELCTDPISSIDPTGITTADGHHREVDVIIYGTGFQASQFLTPMKVVGRDGIDLHDSWDGDARAYLGIVSPGFPNFFYMYGPNTNIVINGSIIYFSECEAHYITQYVRHLLETGTDALDVKQDVHDAYNEWIDAGNRKMAWGASDVSSWYKSASGRVAQNWPYSLIEYWDQTRQLNLDDYETA